MVDSRRLLMADRWRLVTIEPLPMNGQGLAQPWIPSAVEYARHF